MPQVVLVAAHCAPAHYTLLLKRLVRSQALGTPLRPTEPLHGLSAQRHCTLTPFPSCRA